MVTMWTPSIHALYNKTKRMGIVHIPQLPFSCVISWTQPFLDTCDSRILKKMQRVQLQKLNINYLLRCQEPQSIRSQKMEFFIVIIMKTSNLMFVETITLISSSHWISGIKIGNFHFIYLKHNQTLMFSHTRAHQVAYYSYSLTIRQEYKIHFVY
jgi:hypothetical protein